MNFNDILYSLDLFKTPIYFLLNSKMKIPSKFSCFISICIISFLLAFFFQNDIFFNKVSHSSIQSIATKTRPQIQFNYGNMGLAVSLTDSSNIIFEDSSVFNFQMKNYYAKSNGEVIFEEIKELGHCNENNFKTHGTSYEDIGLKKATCPVEGNFTLEGFWDEETTKYVEITVNKCIN